MCKCSPADIYTCTQIIITFIHIPVQLFNPTHVVEPHPAIRQYTRYTAILGVNQGRLMMMLSLSICDTPGMSSQLHAEGEPCRMYLMHIFAHCHAVLFRRRVFSRALGCGARRAREYTRRKCGPRPGFVARALGVQSRGELALSVGSISAEPEPTKPPETFRRLRKRFALCCCVPVSATSTRLALKNAVYFDAATVQHQPRFKLFPA